MTILLRASVPRLLIIVLMIFVGACSQKPVLKVTLESEQNWDWRQQQLANINKWEIHARASIMVSPKPTRLGGSVSDITLDKIYPVGITWSRQQERFSIVIEAPFGQGIIRIESNLSIDKNKQFKLTLADGNYRLGATPDELLVQLLGWSIPVTGLKSWIKGLPQYGVESNYEIDGFGRLKSLRQNGWLVNYLDYFPALKQAQQLPKRLYLKHNNVGIKIVIERWEKFEAQAEQESIFPNFD